VRQRKRQAAWRAEQLRPPVRLAEHRPAHDPVEHEIGADRRTQHDGDGQARERGQAIETRLRGTDFGLFCAHWLALFLLSGPGFLCGAACTWAGGEAGEEDVVAFSPA
jgi:hypothetical protein